MKTLTEISGFTLQDAFEIRKSIVPEPAPAAPETPAVEAAAPESQPAEATTEAPAPQEAAPSEQPAASEAAPSEQAPAEQATEAPAVAKESTEPGRDRNRGRNNNRRGNRDRGGRKPNVQPRPQLPPMTDEVREKLKAAITEKMKIEGDKLNFVIAALEVVGFKLRDLKRVVVYTAADDEKLPANIIKQGEHYFRAEYMAPLERPRQRDDRGGRMGKFGKGGRGGKGRGRGRFGDKGNDRGGPRGDAGGGGGRGDQRRDRRPGGGGRPGARPTNPGPAKNG